MKKKMEMRFRGKRNVIRAHSFRSRNGGEKKYIYKSENNKG
jgi:hypothetical protein